MLDFPKDNSPITGNFAVEAKKWLTAVEHYKQGTATDKEFRLIEEQKLKDNELAEKCSMWNVVYTENPVEYFKSKK